MNKEMQEKVKLLSDKFVEDVRKIDQEFNVVTIVRDDINTSFEAIGCARELYLALFTAAKDIYEEYKEKT